MSHFYRVLWTHKWQQTQPNGHGNDHLLRSAIKTTSNLQHWAGVVNEIVDDMVEGVCLVDNAVLEADITNFFVPLVDCEDWVLYKAGLDPGNIQ